ncbi:hypothetical protein ACI79P_19985 [Blastococcus sp. SYSU DS0510]
MGADVPSTLLAVFGYLLLPASIGAVAALLVEEQLRHARPLQLEDIKRELTQEMQGRRKTALAAEPAAQDEKAP